MNMPEKPTYRYIGTRPPRPDGADKVTGKARYGADFTMPGMVWGAVLRSPHAHARIRSVDASAALAMEGVFAVCTADDIVEKPQAAAGGGEGFMDPVDLSANLLARHKVLYHGHPVAAIAARTRSLAEAALAAIKVEYEPLPAVLDIDSALAVDAPVLHENVFTQGLEAPPSKASNLASQMTLAKGDVDAALQQAEVRVEGTYNIASAHQGYIEPHAVVASVGASGQVEIWGCSQGAFMVRSFTAMLLGMEEADIRVTPSEIGGGFGGKTTVYLEPLAVVLSKKCGRPVKMVMSREEVFRATGPGSAARVWVRIGAQRDGRITAMDARLEFESGAFKGSPALFGGMCMMGPYDVANQRMTACDVIVNKPKVAAYRAPGAPQAIYGIECAVNDLARELGMDPIELRLKNAAKEGSQTMYGETFRRIGLVECLQAARSHPHYSAPLGPNQGRGVAAGFWFNVGMQSSASVHLTDSGRLLISEGNPDIGGTRASMALIAAETLGIPYEDCRPAVVDTNSVGYNDLTGGSRTTFTTGYAVMEACKALVGKLRARAAEVWGVDVEKVEWRDGTAYNLGKAGESLGIKELAAMGGHTTGPLNADASVNLKTAGPGFSVSICDIEIDPETGRSTVLRFTAIQDAGKAIHPDFVEGQMQGGAMQGIGWALNEEYLFDDKGVMLNPGFLDYRMPVASDLPMIDTVIVEVPEPVHPLGIRGVGEPPICSPIPAVVTAASRAAEVDLRDAPLSPTRVLEAMLSKGNA